MFESSLPTTSFSLLNLLFLRKCIFAFWNWFYHDYILLREPFARCGVHVPVIKILITNNREYRLQWLILSLILMLCNYMYVYWFSTYKKREFYCKMHTSDWWLLMDYSDMHAYIYWNPTPSFSWIENIEKKYILWGPGDCLYTFMKMLCWIYHLCCFHSLFLETAKEGRMGSWPPTLANFSCKWIGI